MKKQSHAGHLYVCMYMCCSFRFLFYLKYFYIGLSVYISRHFNDTLVMKTCMSITLISFTYKIISIAIKKERKKKDEKEIVISVLHS